MTSPSPPALPSLCSSSPSLPPLPSLPLLVLWEGVPRLLEGALVCGWGVIIHFMGYHLLGFLGQYLSDLMMNLFKFMEVEGKVWLKIEVWESWHVHLVEPAPVLSQPGPLQIPLYWTQGNWNGQLDKMFQNFPKLSKRLSIKHFKHIPWSSVFSSHQHLCHADILGPTSWRVQGNRWVTISGLRALGKNSKGLPRVRYVISVKREKLNMGKRALERVFSCMNVFRHVGSTPPQWMQGNGPVTLFSGIWVLRNGLKLPHNGPWKAIQFVFLVAAHSSPFKRAWEVSVQRLSGEI